jgi:hypothetical protein
MPLSLPKALGALALLAPRLTGRCPPAVRVLDPGDGTFRAEVTDGRRLLICRGPSVPGDAPGGPGPASDLLIPAADWRAGFRLAGKRERAVALAAEGEEFVLSVGGKAVRGRQHDGRFPPTDAALPRRPGLLTVRVNPQLLAELLQVAAAINPDSGTSLVWYGKDQPLGLVCQTGEGVFLDALIMPLT